MLLKNAEAFLPTPISYTTDWSYDKSCFINFSETLTSVPANKATESGNGSHVLLLYIIQ